MYFQRKYLMKDFNAIFKTYSGKIKTRIGIKLDYGKKFIDIDPQYEYEDQFQRMFFSKPLCVENFMGFFKNKNDIEIVLEVGCSIGMFPRIYHEFFNRLPTGLDFSTKAIESSSNIITPKSLGMPSSYYNIDSKSLVIEINKTTQQNETSVMAKENVTNYGK